jgi:hypothetical protein
MIGLKTPQKNYRVFEYFICGGALYAQKVRLHFSTGCGQPGRHIDAAGLPGNAYPYAHRYSCTHGHAGRHDYCT